MTRPTSSPSRCSISGPRRRSRSGRRSTNGFYYDIEFPDGSPGEEDLARIEEGMKAHIKADEPFERRELPVDRGDRALPRRGPGLQGRADRGPGPRRGRRDRLALPQRPLRGPLPRSARALDRADRRLQAHLACRRLLARRRDAPDADPRLRHRLLRQEGARAAPRAARAGPRARPPPARARARSLPVPRRRRPGCRSGCRRGPCCFG